MPLPSVEILRELLDYNPETGSLTWRARPVGTWHDQRWNTRHAGREAGSLKPDGYRKLDISNRRLFAHRVAWKIAYGDEPPTNIDHVNGNPSDNRLANLRAATGAQNQANLRLRRDSSTGAKGVYFDKSQGKFRAQVGANGRRYRIGPFDTIAEAKAARDAKARELHGEFFSP